MPGRVFLQKKLPIEVSRVLGNSNREIIRKLIDDIIQNSKGKDSIIFSDEIFSAMKLLYNYDESNIYKNRLITEQNERIDQMLNDLFYLFLYIVESSKRGIRKIRNYRGQAIDTFYAFMKEMNYSSDESDAQIVSDFISGMTDLYATRVYQEMFLLSSPV